MKATSVVASTVTTRRSPSGASRWRSPPGAGTDTRGTRASTPIRPSAVSAVMNHIVARQPRTLPTTVPIGAPRAVAAVSPVVTAAMARPRRSGSTRLAAVTLAAGM